MELEQDKIYASTEGPVRYVGTGGGWLRFIKIKEGTPVYIKPKNIKTFLTEARSVADEG